MLYAVVTKASVGYQTNSHVTVGPTLIPRAEDGVNSPRHQILRISFIFWF